MAGKTNRKSVPTTRQAPPADPIPADSVTPPGQPKRGDKNSALFLETEYDQPIDPVNDSDRHTDLMLALFHASEMMRKKALKWVHDVDWSGTTHQESESDMEHYFQRASVWNGYADALLEEFHRGCRRAWIAHFPRTGRPYRPQMYAIWKRREKRDKARWAKQAKAARS